MTFVGRENEKKLLRGWIKTGESHLTVIYGRRRIGKTRLVEEAFPKLTDGEYPGDSKDILPLRFEGLEDGNTKTQKENFLAAFFKQTKMPSYPAIDTSKTKWRDLLIMISDYIGKRKAVVFLDEVQWIAAERNEFISHFKFVWDNYFKKKNHVHLILCGSVSSFIVKKILRSKALYGRIDTEIELQPLSLPSLWKGFLSKRSLLEVAEWYMIVGGIPKYYEITEPADSVRLNIERLCLGRNAYLFGEIDRLFVSHFGKNKDYRNIVNFLAERRFSTREEIARRFRMNLGGGLSDLLEELNLAGFIDTYSSIGKSEESRLKRHRVADPYLRFYFRFIEPNKIRIKNSAKLLSFNSVISEKSYDIWRGLAFECLCRNHADLLAEKLGFSAVSYERGSWFQRKDQKAGFQIDLLFRRADRVLTLCEVKYRVDDPKKVIEQVKNQVSKIPNPTRLTIEKVLITAIPPNDRRLLADYFSRILTMEDLFTQE